jgi:NTE family protein
MKRSVSLVLGSGGARGLAHIGIIQWLEENGFEIKSVSGSSMGALVGGFYAAGKLDAYTQWVKTVSKMDILKLLDISLRRDGLVKGERIINTLKEFVGEWQIESLPIAFTAVATDIVHEKEVWINKGSLFDAIRASMSIPLFFTPYTIGSHTFVDGGILNPVPIAPTFQDRTDFTIAVNLAGASDPDLDGNTVNVQEEKKESFWYEWVTRFLDDFQPAKTVKESMAWSYFDVASKSLDAMQGTIARQKLAAYPPDYLVEIPRNACGMLEFDLAEEMIALGRKKAQEQLSRMK